jgi:hypothetical protein
MSKSYFSASYQFDCGPIASLVKVGEQYTLRVVGRDGEQVIIHGLDADLLESLRKSIVTALGLHKD